MSLVKDPFKVYNYGNEELRKRTNVVYVRENLEQDFVTLKEEYSTKVFEDPNFPHHDNSIGFDSTKPPTKFEQYCKSKGWDGKTVEWARLNDLVNNETFVVHKNLKGCKPVFCSKALDPNNQLIESVFRLSYDESVIGSCWFVSALCIAALNPGDINFIVPSDNHLDDPNNDFGIYHFRFWYQGCWVDIVVDDCLPFVRTNNGIILLGSNIIENGDEVEFWMVLAVKAFAKLVGNYKRVLGGSPSYSPYEFLTGGFCQTIKLDNALNSDNDKGLWDDLKYCTGSSNTNIIISLTCSREKEGLTAEDINDFGLENEHSYRLINSATINGIKVVKMRNPVDHKESKGEQRFDKDDIVGTSFWSNIAPEEIERAGIKPSKPGEFLMSYSDALKCFHNVQICSQLNFYKRAVDTNMFNLELYEGEFGASKPTFTIVVGESDLSIVTIGLTLKAPIDDVPEYPIDVQLFPAGQYVETKAETKPRQCVIDKIVEIPCIVLTGVYKFVCCRGPDEPVPAPKLIGMIPTEGSRDQVQQRNKSISFLFSDLEPGKYIVAPTFLNAGAFNQKFVLKIFYPAAQ